MLIALRLSAFDDDRYVEIRTGRLWNQSSIKVFRALILGFNRLRRNIGSGDGWDYISILAIDGLVRMFYRLARVLARSLSKVGARLSGLFFITPSVPK